MTLLSGLKCFFKTDATVIDNHVFRLHNQTTFYILIAFAILVKIEQYLEDPIHCLSRAYISEKIVDQLCWTHATYSVLEHFEKRVGEQVPYPGIGSHRGQNIVYHTYYRWVYYVLFLQAICFYMPGYFWKRMEGGRIRNLIKGLNSPVMPEDAKVLKKNLIVEYMVYNNSNNHNFYFIAYTVSEIMNFVNVIGQLFLMNAFLGGEFLSSVPSVFEISEWGRVYRYDPILKIFPRITKCSIFQYGSRADVESYDAMCTLTVNNINEKIYIFLYFWFVILAVLSGVALLYRVVIILYPKSRLMIIPTRLSIENKDYLAAILKKCKLEDWLILDMLSKNLDPFNFREILNEFARRLDLNNLSSSNLSLKMMHDTASV